MNLNKLKDPFPLEDIGWLATSTNIKSVQKKDSNARFPTMVLYVPYVDNRAIMDRLDDVCGSENWRNEFHVSPLNNGILCGISIRIDGEWVTKWDGAEPTNFEPVKGALSNSMKRAGVQWGIGRYLYNYEPRWVAVKQEYGSPPVEPLTLPKELLPSVGYILSVPSQPKEFEQFSLLLKDATDLFVPEPHPLAGKSLTELVATHDNISVKTLEWLAGEYSSDKIPDFATSTKYSSVIHDVALDLLKYIK